MGDLIYFPGIYSRPETNTQCRSINQAATKVRLMDRDWREFAVGRYVKRDNVHRTNRFEFDRDTCTATSYGWWVFVKKVGKTIYVNRARYSMQTDIHQDMADNILKFEQPELYGIKIVSVYYRCGLNHLDRAISDYEYWIRQHTEDMVKPRTHKLKNLWRKAEIKRLRKEIVNAKRLDKILYGSTGSSS